MKVRLGKTPWLQHQMHVLLWECVMTSPARLSPVPRAGEPTGGPQGCQGLR